MKKIMFLAAIAAAMVISCGKGGNENQAPEVKDASIDSLAYNLGLAQSGGLKQYMTMQLGVDSAFIDDFIRGMKEGATASDKAALAYNKGLQVGGDIQNMAKGLTAEIYGQDSTKRIGTEKIVAGLTDGLKMADGAVKDSTIQKANESFNSKIQEIHDKVTAETYADWKKQNEEFIAKAKKNSEYKALSNGVLYKVIEAGKGGPGSAYDKDSVVTCDYKGTLINDSVFDSSEGKEPIKVDMKHPAVIPGWVEALKVMPKGAKWEVIIPQDQAYGSRNAGQIKPFSTLIFTIETK